MDGGPNGARSEYDSRGRYSLETSAPLQPAQAAYVPHSQQPGSTQSYSSSTLNDPSAGGGGGAAIRPGMDRRSTSGFSGLTGFSNKDENAPVGFDEGILRGLCEIDCSLPLVSDRIKQSIASCKQVAVFFRSRAEIEEKYARSVIELYRMSGDVYGRSDCKAGTFVNAYHGSLRLQENVAQQRIRYAQRLNEMSDELLGLAREGEKLRKMHKENGTRYQNALHESESSMEKAKSRFDATAEELERVLVAKEGESMKDSGMRSSTSLSSANAGAAGNANGLNSPTGSNAGGASNNKKGFGKAMKSGATLFKGKGPASMARQEDDVRSRMASASETFRKAALEAQTLRQDYFNFQLPKVLRSLKECADELDLGTQYHLTRFAFLTESTTVSEGSLLSPVSSEDGGPGLKAIFEAIDNRTDFKNYMQNYAVARGAPKGPRRDGAFEDGYLAPPLQTPRSNASPALSPQHSEQGQHLSHSPMPSIASPNGGQGAYAGHAQQQHAASQQQQEPYAVPGIPASTGATYGVDLGEQLMRDAVEIPKVVEKCAKAIEEFGLESMGIYRLSGMTSKVQALKGALDRDIDGTDVSSDEWSADINVVSSALKLWFRELPEPLLTYALYHPFIEAARFENDRLRHIRLHEQVNELPDPNYATLKFFMGHLDKIRRKSDVNQMSISNLSIVFGPTLLGAPPEEGGLNLEHMSFQCKAIETILEKYNEIFVEEEEAPDGP